LKKHHSKDAEQRSRSTFVDPWNLTNFRKPMNSNNCQRYLKALSIATIALPISLALAPLARSQNATSLNVTFLNDTNAELTSVQVAPPNTRAWGANLLDSPTSNDAIDLTIADQADDCNYDLRATFSNGTTIEDFDVNFCQYDVYTFASVPALW
jgi:hypothetical protein